MNWTPYRPPGRATPMKPEESAVFIAWLRYCVESERYDRSICLNRDPRTREAIPLSHEERRASGIFARNLMKRLGLDRPLNERERAARDWADSLTFEEQERALAALERAA